MREESKTEEDEDGFIAQATALIEREMARGQTLFPPRTRIGSPPYLPVLLVGLGLNERVNSPRVHPLSRTEIGKWKKQTGEWPAGTGRVLIQEPGSLPDELWREFLEDRAKTGISTLITK
jgi:hypothetical protein